jgi:Zn-finger protein
LQSRCLSINQLNAVSKTFCRQTAGILAGIILAVDAAQGTEAPAKFLGANSCSSSSCHGGGGAYQSQFLVWTLKDFHSQRPPATLATARSKQIADALGLKDPAADARCTVCHAPLHELPDDQRGEHFKVSEGVSCESCHGPAEHWIRSHTRHDYTRADRIAAGMRDLQNLYVRANVCAACHQNVDADILAAGHPELIFELDGQSVAEPKHWRAEKNGNGAQAWLVGQAVALRELSWQMTQPRGFTESPQRSMETNLLDRIFALSWLLEKATGEELAPVTTVESFESRQRMADQLARDKSQVAWTEQTSRDYLMRLAGLGASFSDTAISRSLQARRAERLVLGLDRLLAALPEFKNNEPAQSALKRLFKLAQSVPDFDPQEFAATLEKFSQALAARKEARIPAYEADSQLFGFSKPKWTGMRVSPTL